ETAIIRIADDCIIRMVTGDCPCRRLDRLPERIPWAPVDVLDGIDLSRCEAAIRLISGALQGKPRIREHIGGRIECPLTRLKVVDHAIDRSVETIACLKNSAREKLLVSHRKRRI